MHTVSRSSRTAKIQAIARPRRKGDDAQLSRLLEAFRRMKPKTIHPSPVGQAVQDVRQLERAAFRCGLSGIAIRLATVRLELRRVAEGWPIRLRSVLHAVAPWTER